MTEDDWMSENQKLELFSEKVRQLIQDDFSQLEQASIHKSTIYHYTDVKGALGILSSGCLWFTERTHLNDPVEIQYGLNIAHEIFEATARENEKITRDAASHLRGEHFYGLGTFGFWSCSFSLDDNDLSQWRSYADDGRGVCLGFSTDAFEMSDLAKTVPGVANSLRFPVLYDELKLRWKLKRYVDAAIELLAEVDLTNKTDYVPHGRAMLYERDVFRTLNDGFYANAILHKHPAYDREEEYRLFVSGLRQTVSTNGFHRLRERRGEIVGYLDLPIPTWKERGVLTAVRAGPAAPEQLIDQLRTTIMTLGIPIPTIDKSSIPYRSTS